MSQEGTEATREAGGHDAGGMMRWLLTYADMITLLMAFFIMMYSMSVLNREKFQKAAAGLRAQFGPQRMRFASGGAGMGIGPHREAAEARRMAELRETLESVEDQLQDYIEANQLETVVSTQRETRGLVVSLVSDNLLFPAGEAELRPEALSLLSRIAGLLKQIPHPISVEGHTCDIPISTERFPSNWELSAARACSVVRYLSEQQGISPTRLSAIGMADTRPVAPNKSPRGRARNRRVDIVILEQWAPAGDAGKETGQ